MKNMALLIDTNILIDVLCEREEFFLESKKVFDLCCSRKTKGIIAAHSITNIFYILRKGTDNTGFHGRWESVPSA